VSDITLPRAVIEMVRDSLDYARRFNGASVSAEIAALDAALAEPDAKKKPATMKQISAAHGTTIGAPWFEDFARAWKAAERHHGIRKKDK
jgi:hypothetical protein